MRSLASAASARLTAAPPSGQDDALRRGSSGQDVALLQYRLDRMGYRGPGESPLPQHGQFDAATEHGVRQFQEANQLPTTGVVDPSTVQTLAVAQQAHAMRPTPSAQREQLDEPKAEREALSRVHDAPAASVAPILPPAQSDDRSAPQNVREAPHAESAPSAPSVAAERPEQDRPQRHAQPDQRGSAPDAHPAEPGRSAASAQPTPPESRPAPAMPPATAEAPTSIEPATPPSHAAELADRAPLAPTPPPQPVAPEREPVIDLSHFSRSDQAMIAKIRANAPDGLPDEHAAAAMLAAKRNGIQDADRLGP
ncbi:peptidoglycan-binding protein, partial [Lysobacter yananisis]|uniref:peptidoglycan-binding protein n=1 Tax=Lysobacter yananisis TaxID=1003114 RepID=UPI00300ACE75